MSEFKVYAVVILATFFFVLGTAGANAAGMFDCHPKQGEMFNSCAHLDPSQVSVR